MITSCNLSNEDSIFLFKSFKSKLNASLVDKSNLIVADAPGMETAGIVIIPYSFNNMNENNQNKTFVILTGEPNNYLTKNDFLKHHPEYEVTGSWKKVQIVFTNDLNSNTGKMKQARAKGIEIRVY